MLKRVKNVGLRFQPRLFSKTGKLFVCVGRQSFFYPLKLTKVEYQQLLQSQATTPVPFVVNRTQYWIFRGQWWSDDEGLSLDEFEALTHMREQKRRATILRAQSYAALPDIPVASRRGSIPDDVKLFVLKRDAGACVKCATVVEIQFDHIIPVALGGSSTVENLQILCGPCNRRKGASVA